MSDNILIEYNNKERNNMNFKKKQPRPISEVKFEMLMMERMLNEYEAIAPLHEVKSFKEKMASERYLTKNLPLLRLMRATLKTLLMRLA